MVKDTTGLMGIYVAIGLLSLVVAYMAYDHVRMMRMLHDKKKLCKLVASCKVEGYKREPQKMEKVPKFKKDDFGPAPVHHRWMDCLNDMKAQGRADLAAFIQQQVAQHGDQQLLAVPGGCSGAGCPHDVTSCDNYWAAFASSMKQ